MRARLKLRVSDRTPNVKKKACTLQLVRTASSKIAKTQIYTNIYIATAVGAAR